MSNYHQLILPKFLTYVSTYCETMTDNKWRGRKNLKEVSFPIIHSLCILLDILNLARSNDLFSSFFQYQHKTFVSLSSLSSLFCFLFFCFLIRQRLVIWCRFTNNAQVFIGHLFKNVGWIDLIIFLRVTVMQKLTWTSWVTSCLFACSLTRIITSLSASWNSVEASAA